MPKWVSDFSVGYFIVWKSHINQIFVRKQTKYLIKNLRSCWTVDLFQRKLNWAFDIWRKRKSMILLKINNMFKKHSVNRWSGVA